MALEPITRQEKIISGENLKPITRMEKFLKRYGGATSWNDLKDKPFSEVETVVNEPLNITWAGNTDGLVTATLGGTIFYKVSDLILTEEQFKSATVLASDGYELTMGDAWDEFAEMGMITEDFYFGDGLVCNVKKDGLNIYDGYFAESGIYFMKMNGIVYTCSLITAEPVEHTKTVVKKIDEKFLPDVGGGASTLIVHASTEDYESYTIDHSYDEIKAYAQNGGNVEVQFMWGPNSNQICSYVAPLSSVDMNYIYFTVDSNFPTVGKLIVSVSQSEVYIEPASYLPCPNSKGAYIVGKNNFEWEISKNPIVYSPKGTKYKITVDDTGNLTATKV